MGFFDGFFDMLSDASSILNNVSISITIGRLITMRKGLKSLLVDINSCPDSLSSMSSNNAEKILNDVKNTKSSINSIGLDSIKMYSRMLKVLDNYVADGTFNNVDRDMYSLLTTYKELLDNYDDLESDDVDDIEDIYQLNDVLESITFSMKAELNQYLDNLNELSNDFEYYNGIYQKHQYD